ncbi:MAG: GxxExxY protein [candidate division KSB1 bacterium]|nr:GxxExxY protein [candidate division KSB1 bacterium]
MVNENNFPSKELSYKVLGCAFDAFKKVGVGFNEIMYHKVFHQNLVKCGIDARYKVPIFLDYEGELLAEFEIDEVVENKLIVELKCLQSGFLDENYAQIFCYLKKTGIRIGLLINFGLHKAVPKRVIYTDERIPNIEKFDHHFLEEASQMQLINKIIAISQKIDRMLGSAYLGKNYKSAFAIELKKNNLSFNDQVQINTNVDGIPFPPYEIDYWLIENSLLLGILAGGEHPGNYNLFRMRNYLKKLKLNRGLIAHWSTKNLQLYGIYEP